MHALQVHASRTSRSFYAAAQGAVARPQLTPDLPLLMYRRQMELAVAGAKKTRDGLPTYVAIGDREWIDRRTAETDREGWLGSFEAACHWLGLNADEERTRLLVDIDAELERQALVHVRTVTYLRRAAVLTCMGLPTRLGRQYTLGLVPVDEYEQLALLDAEPMPRGRPGKGAGSRVPLPAARAPRPRPRRPVGGRTRSGSSPEVGACG